MSPRTTTRGASPKQLSYLKNLASQAGITFIFPHNRHQASREIERLKVLKARRGRCLETSRLEVDPVEPDPVEQPYATEQKSGEVIGYGASARRADPAPHCAAPAPRRTDEPFELGRYETGSGEHRALYGVRVDGKPRIIDAAAEGTGRIYTVEQDLRDKGGYGEVKALVADYLEQAGELGRIPMAAARRREQMGADA